MLSGQPGIFSARWAGRHGDDAANLELLLAQLADVPDEHRGARVRLRRGARGARPGTTASREAVSSRASSTGRSCGSRAGTGGFGYDPVFEPDGSADHRRADPAEKDAISHRGQAFRALVPVLASCSASLPLGRP